MISQREGEASHFYLSQTLPRHQTVPVQVGTLSIGGHSPIVVQSMTNTDTSDQEATAQQCFALWQAGSQLVRITVNNAASAAAVPYIYERLQQLGWDKPILVGDFHYIGHKLLVQYPACAQALAKYRINPGNVGFGDKHDPNYAQMIEVALKYNKPIRIGVNWGSLDQALLAEMMDQNRQLSQPKTAKLVLREALIHSALGSAKQAQQMGMPANKIILSVKVSQVQELVAIYTELANRCHYALHLGLTEAGLSAKGMVSTAAAFSLLLQQGIGDTIRASLTPEPGGDRTQEVRVCQEILQALELSAFTPSVTACPGCGRTTSTVFQALAQQIESHIKVQMPSWRQKFPGIEHLKVAVMGCVVNGPGESKHADIGISLPGTGETPAAPVFIDGKKSTVLRGNDIGQQFIELLNHYIQQRYTTTA